MNKLILMVSALLVFGACSSEDQQPNTDIDSGQPDTEQPDSEESDVEPDAEDPDVEETDADVNEDGCIQATASENFSVNHADGVSIEYWTSVSPQIGGSIRNLAILFERYGDAEYEGTFELGEGGRDANFGNCAHCVFLRSDDASTAYYADRGTLVVGGDVFGRNLDISVSNLRLIEVTVNPETRESTPIEGGGCIEFEDFAKQGVYPPDAWTCPVDDYDDGEFCNCECGAFDPDCATSPDCLPGMPGCEEVEILPVADCTESEVCAFEPISGATACMESCDWSGAQGCTSGTCVFDFGTGDGDLCLEDSERILDGVALGETCPSTGLQGVCAVSEGFARGYCDADDVCRPVCAEDSECEVEGEICVKFADPEGLGYCGVDPFAG